MNSTLAAPPMLPGSPDSLMMTCVACGVVCADDPRFSQPACFARFRLNKSHPLITSFANTRPLARMYD